MLIWNCCTRVDIDSMNFEKFHILSLKEEMPPIMERPVSEELLEEIEIWWLKYELRRCLREDPVNLDEVFKWKAVMPDKYILGYDIIKAIRDAINMQPNYKEGKALDYFMSTSF
jgi:hypothetical protein